MLTRGESSTVGPLSVGLGAPPVFVLPPGRPFAPLSSHRVVQVPVGLILPSLLLVFRVVVVFNVVVIVGIGKTVALVVSKHRGNVVLGGLGSLRGRL